MENFEIDDVGECGQMDYDYIIFDGKVGKECQQYLRRRYATIFMLLFGVGLLITFVTIYYFLRDEVIIIIGAISLPIFVFLGRLTGFSFVNIPTRIVFENEVIGVSYIDSTSKEIKELTRSFDDVVSVIDLGYAYYIKISQFRPFHDCICQKNLLSHGSLEDFETIFKNYIVRKKIQSSYINN